MKDGRVTFIVRVFEMVLWILMVISYRFRDPAAFLVKRNIQSLFVDQGLGHRKDFLYNFKKVGGWGKLFKEPKFKQSYDLFVVFPGPIT